MPDDALTRALEALRVADDMLYGEGLGDGRIDDVLAEHGIAPDRKRFDWEPQPTQYEQGNGA